MTINQKIQNYIYGLTNGIINIDDEQAGHIINIVLQPRDAVEVNKLVFDRQTGDYKQYQKFYVAEKTAQMTILKVHGTKQYKGFYKFTISQFNFSIETVNPYLFTV